MRSFEQTRASAARLAEDTKRRRRMSFGPSFMVPSSIIKWKKILKSFIRETGEIYILSVRRCPAWCRGQLADFRAYFDTYPCTSERRCLIISITLSVRPSILISGVLYSPRTFVIMFILVIKCCCKHCHGFKLVCGCVKLTSVLLWLPDLWLVFSDITTCSQHLHEPLKLRPLKIQKHKLTHVLLRTCI